MTTAKERIRCFRNFNTSPNERANPDRETTPRDICTAKDNQQFATIVGTIASRGVQSGEMINCRVGKMRQISTPAEDKLVPQQRPMNAATRARTGSQWQLRSAQGNATTCSLRPLTSHTI